MVCGFQLQFWGTKTRKGWGKAVPSYQLWLAGVWGGVAWLETGLRQQHSDITQFPGHPVISIVSCIFLSSMALHTTSTSLPQGDHCFVVGLALQFLQEEPPSGSLTTRTWISSRWAPPCFVGCPRILCGGAVAAAPGAAPDLFLFVISSRSTATCHPPFTHLFCLHLSALDFYCPMMYSSIATICSVFTMCQAPCWVVHISILQLRKLRQDRISDLTCERIKVWQGPLHIPPCTDWAFFLVTYIPSHHKNCSANELTWEGHLWVEGQPFHCYPRIRLCLVS